MQEIAFLYQKEDIPVTRDRKFGAKVSVKTNLVKLTFILLVTSSPFTILWPNPSVLSIYLKCIVSLSKIFLLWSIWNSGSSLSNHPPHGAHTRSRIANHPLMTWFINHQPRSLAWTLPPSWVWLHTQACNHLFLSSTYIPGIWTELLICVGSSSSMPIGGPMIHSPTHPGQIPRGHLRIPPSLHHPLRPAGPFCPGLPLESHPATDASVQSLISGLLPEGPASALSSPSAKLSKQNWSHSATANIPGNSASPNRLKPKPVSIVLYELVPNYLFNFISLVLFFP